jgi:hypothetical protein
MSAQDTLQHIANCEARAVAQPGKAIRVTAGYYFVQTARGLVEIDHVQARQDDTEWSGWVGRSADGRRVNDPVATLKEAIDGAQYL